IAWRTAENLPVVASYYPRIQSENRRDVLTDAYVYESPNQPERYRLVRPRARGGKREAGAITAGTGTRLFSQ
ncbi:MAG: hypothetical protein ACJ793_06675, partial [Gemmatimonadaceae bacterium]